MVERVTADGFFRAAADVANKEGLGAVLVSTPSGRGSLFGQRDGSFRFNHDYSQLLDSAGQHMELTWLRATLGATGRMPLPNGDKLAEFLVEMRHASYYKPGVAPSIEKLQGLVDAHLKAISPSSNLSIPVVILNPSGRSVAELGGLFKLVDDTWNQKDRSLWGDRLDSVSSRIYWNADLYRTELLERTIGDDVENGGIEMLKIVNDLTMALVNVRRIDKGIVDVMGSGRQYFSSKLDDIISELVRKAAMWTVAEDLLFKQGYGRENPYTPLCNLLRMGVFPIGVDKDGGKFLVFVPPVFAPTR